MSKPDWSKMTIMIPRPRPDRDISGERLELKERILKNGLKETINEMVEEYYQWDDDPNPASARRKKRATLIFSKAELKKLIPIEIYRLLGNFEFIEKPK